MKKVPEKELLILQYGFVVTNIVHSIILITLCSFSVFYIGKTNLNYILPIDATSLLIALIILGFIIVVVGWVVGMSNTGLGWTVFHCCMGVLIIIEVLISISTSKFSNLMNSIDIIWSFSDNAQKNEIQTDLHCCGLYNKTDRHSDPCPSGSQDGCMIKIRDLFIQIRWVTSTALFVCFIVGLFLDLAGYAICVHPEKIVFDPQNEIYSIDSMLIDLEHDYIEPSIL